MQQEEKQKFVFLYNPDLTKTLDQEYFRYETKLTGEEFNGLLMFIYVHLSLHLGDMDELYKNKKLTTEYFCWGTKDTKNITELIKNEEREYDLGCNIADFVNEELILGSIFSRNKKYIPEITKYEELEKVLLGWNLDIDYIGLKKYRNKNINIITNSKRYPWFILNSKTSESVGSNPREDSEYLKGIELGCKLYNVNSNDYIYTINNKLLS